ncbi:MepB family protein [Galbibacter orientalis]
MNPTLSNIITNVYAECKLEISNFKTEIESKEYFACTFRLNEFAIIYREAKVTPKKAGQFVTFWKRTEKGPIAPYCINDPFNFYVVTVKTANKLGQFVFPKSVLIQKGIISTENKEGKRAFRVYPPWDNPQNKQAERSQKWQLAYFYQINENLKLTTSRQAYEVFKGK